jgi:hypothetical protein
MSTQGFDIGSLDPVLLDEMFSDIRTDLDKAVPWTKISEVKPAKYRAGETRLWATPLEVAQGGQRTSKVAHGSATPKGNTSLSTRPYKVEEYRWGLPIEEGAEEEINSFEDVASKFAMSCSLKVYRDFAVDVRALITGQDADNTITQRSLTGNAWNAGTPGDPLVDIDFILQALRGAQDQVCCLMGYDVALALSRNPFFTGSAAGSGREFVDFDMIRAVLSSRGVKGEIVIDEFIQNNTESNYTRNMAGVFDGVFYIGVRNNLKTMQFKALQGDIYDDKDTRIKVFRAFHESDMIRGYANQGYYISGTLG